MSGVQPVEERYPGFQRFARNADVYLCLHRPWLGVDCAQRRGDFRRILAEGKTFFIGTNK